MKKSDIYFVLLVSTLCLAFIGVPLAWLNPVEINPDPYFHIQLANYYLFSGHSDVRDALTVGPLIPALYALIKWIGLHFIAWTADYEIYLLKGLSFVCFFIISIIFATVNTKEVGRQNTLILLAIFLGLMQVSMDALSPNGELVAVTLLMILFYLLSADDYSFLRVFIAALLTIFIVYTKLQAIPLLLLILGYGFWGKRGLKFFLITAASLISCIDFVFYIKGAGILYNLTTLIKYVSDGALASSGGTVGKVETLLSFHGRAKHFLWIMNQTILNFPLLAYIVITFIFSQQKYKNPFLNWKIWAFFTFFIMVLPGRQFEHYTLFAIPFVLIFSGRALCITQSINATLSSSVKRFKLPFLAIPLVFGLFLYKALLAFPERNYFNGNPSVIYSALPERVALGEIKKILMNNPGPTFIHGWDYSVNLYLDLYSNRFEMPMLMARAITEQEYINTIVKNNYKYIVDITQYQGLIKGPEYTLSGNSLVSKSLSAYYDLLYESSVPRATPSNDSNDEILRLYRLK